MHSVQASLALRKHISSLTTVIPWCVLLLQSQVKVYSNHLLSSMARMTFIALVVALLVASAIAFIMPLSAAAPRAALTHKATESTGVADALATDTDDADIDDADIDDADLDYESALKKMEVSAATRCCVHIERHCNCHNSNQ
jgi:hypothetical protein